MVEMKKLLALILAAGLAAPGLAAPPPAGSGRGQQQEKEQIQARSGAAQAYLSQLAAQMKSRRTSGALIGGIGGAAGLVGGLALLTGEDDEFGFTHAAGAGLAVMGGALLVGSAITLAVPSRPEKEQARVDAIPDPAQKEKAAADALADLARRGKKSRMILGGIGSAAAVGCSLAADPDAGAGVYVLCAIIGAAAVYSFLAKSPEEKAYAAYSASSRVKPAPELSIGLAPHGGIQAAFSLGF